MSRFTVNQKARIAGERRPVPHHFERVGSQQPVASSFNQTVCIAPQLFRDLVVRSCVSRFTVNKKAHHLCLVSLLTRKPHIKGIVQFPKRTRRRLSWIRDCPNPQIVFFLFFPTRHPSSRRRGYGGFEFLSFLSLLRGFSLGVGFGYSRGGFLFNKKDVYMVAQRRRPVRGSESLKQKSESGCCAAGLF